MGYETLRQRLVEAALAWENEFKIMPNITGALAEVDAVSILQMPFTDYEEFIQHRTAASPGYDIKFKDVTYQVKARRSKNEKKAQGAIGIVASKKENINFDKLLYIEYSPKLKITGAFLWTREAIADLDLTKRISPSTMRKGQQLTV